jgi:hypothetical protein
MRIHDDRYNRDLRRFEVAMRFIQYEARTHTIRLWTGLTDDRIRKLYRNYTLDVGGARPVRHRGKSPQQSAFFTRSARARQESAVLASLCRLIGALPASPAGEPTRSPAGLGRGELLCQAYETYRSLIGTPLITFEHAVFLLNALWRGDELVIGSCRDCGAVLVTDRWAMRAPCCSVCAPPARPAAVSL